jgi:hypothetical protein
MALTSGLSSFNIDQETDQPDEQLISAAPADTPAPEVAQTPPAKIDSTVRLQQQRLAYDQQLQKMIESLQTRQNQFIDPKLAAMSAAFLDPGKTGSFGEAFGRAVKGYSDTSQQQLKDDLEKRKMEAELRGIQIGLTKDDYALQKELEGKQYTRDILSGKLGTKPQTLFDTASGDMSKLDANDIINQAKSGNLLITREMVGLAPTKDSHDTLAKLYDDQQKDLELQQKRYGAAPRVVMGEKMDLNVDQSERLGLLEAKTAEMVKKGQITEDQATQYKNQFLLKEGIIKGSTTKMPDGKTTQAFETPQQIAQKRDIEKVRGTKQAEQDVADQTAIEDRRTSAMETKRDANAILSFALDENTKNAFGILGRPGLKSAFGEILREPARFGNTSVGMANIENIIRKAGGTQEEIEAAQNVSRYISKLELGASAVFKGQGQVSDNERLIIRNVVPALSDNPRVAALKAESIIARADYDVAMAAEYQAYQSQTGGSLREFKGSDIYKNVNDQYDQQLAGLLNKYGYKSAQQIKPKKADATTTQTGSSLWQSIKKQKENTP